MISAWWLLLIVPLTSFLTIALTAKLAGSYQGFWRTMEEGDEPVHSLINWFWGWLDIMKYVLAPREQSSIDYDIPWLTVVFCRYKGHPAGERYYNSGGLEPDYHCRNCNEEIG